MATNLDPQLLAQILAMQQGQGLGQWSGTGNLRDWMVDRRRDVVGHSGGDAGTELYSDPITRLYHGTGHETWGQDTADVYDAQGNYIGPSSGDSEALGIAKFIAMSLAAGYGADALNGAYGGAAAGTVTANDVAMMAANGMTDAQIATAIGSEAAQAMGLAGAGTGMTFAETTALAAEQGATNTAAEEAAKKAAESSIGNGAKNAVDAAGWAKTLLPIAGAVTGAIDAGDKEQTSSRDPWAPAQPYLKGLLSDGAQLYDQYKQQPFSQSQQAGYTNIGSLLDLVNNNAGGLLSGFRANASGANQFQRGTPGLLQGSSFNPTAEQWQPQGYGDMGMAQFRRGR